MIFFSFFGYNLNKPQTRWSNKESHVNVGTLSNAITWLLHMAVQVYGLPFSLQVTYQNISWGTAGVNFEVPTLIYYNNDKEQLINIVNKCGQRMG